MAVILCNMETGVKIFRIVKKFKVKDADAYTFFEFIVTVTWIDFVDL